MPLNGTAALALGGIATAIGAIWTAVVTRRLPRVTEESLREQNKRARLNLEVDLKYKLLEQWTSRPY
jgi:hypothetical protein